MFRSADADTVKALKKILPAADWLSDYDKSDVRGDLTAGITVGVMLIPQSMAYAMLAGVPPIYGLYAGLVPLVIYALLGTSRHLAIGTASIDMLIVGAGVGAVAANDAEHIELAILVAAMAGLIEVGMGVFRFGFMVNFLSRPVIVGFMTAAPLIIAASQLGPLMGVDLPDSQYVHTQVWAAIQNLQQVNVPAVSVGGAGIVVLLGLEKWKPKWPSSLVWVALATLVAWGFGLRQEGLEVVGQVPEGWAALPSLQMQAWDWSSVQSLGATALTLALVQFMAVMSLGQAFASEHGYEVDANRELIAIGSSNIVGSFFRSIQIGRAHV